MAIRYLTDICDIQYGFAFDASGFTTSAEEGMPLVRIRDVMNGRTETYFKGNYPQEYIIHKGDFLVGMDGEFNIAPWKSEDALLNQRVCRVKSNQSGVSTKFLFWFLKKELKRIEDETPFVTVKHLSAKRLKQVQLEVPSIQEQEKIVAELDCLSGIIEKKKQQLKELDNLAQSIFYDMFGDPNVNDKHWRTTKFSETCKNLDYQRKPITAKDRVAGPIPYYGASGIVDWVKDFIFDGDYLLISEDGANLLMRHTPIAFSAKGKTWVNNHAHILQFEHLYGQRFMEYFINLMDISSLITGAAQPKLTQANLNSIDVFDIPASSKVEFSQKIEAIEKHKELIKKSIQETETLFNSRMDYWFS